MMLLEYLRFFSWVFRKMDKMIKNLSNVGGPTPRRSDLTLQRRPTPRRGMPTPRRGQEENLARLGYAATKGYAAA